MLRLDRRGDIKKTSYRYWYMYRRYSYMYIYIVPVHK